MKTLIYGAGTVGLQLLRALNVGREYKPVAFVDDDKSLWGQTINEVKVYMPDKIAKLIERNGVKEILLALSSAPLHQRRTVIRSLSTTPAFQSALRSRNLRSISSAIYSISSVMGVG